MRLRLVEVEGTPEEIRRLDIEHLLGRSLPASLGTVVVDHEPADGPRALGAILDAEAPPGRSRELLESFFDTVQSWGDVSVVPSWRSGTPSRVSYLRVHRHPRTRGAFVYVFPARLRMNFRLPATAATGSDQAVARDVKEDNAYQVSVSLSDGPSLDEAVRLARQAYDAVGGPQPS